MASGNSSAVLSEEECHWLALTAPFQSPRDRVSLRYGLETVGDLVAKVRRERERLHYAVQRQNEALITDTLFNFSITAYHVRDWLMADQLAMTAKRNVARRVARHEVLRICQDLCNSNKHRYLAHDLSTAFLIENTDAAIRILLLDGHCYDLVEFADAVIAAWEELLGG